MSVLPVAVARYLERRAIAGPWHIAGTERTDFCGAVVIPALAESAELFVALKWLAKNPPELLEQFLLLVVINQREDAAVADKRDNAATLDRLPRFAHRYPQLKLGWIDAASAGRELAPGDGGVGVARKIGLDLALQRCDYVRTPPVLVCLDADTLVLSNYLAAIRQHFATASAGGAVIPFCHRRGADSAGQAAIDLYELYLRHHLLGLTLARSPYAWHTIGSTVAVRVDAYVAAGGMNRRQAGEDFYFVQQLVKTCGVSALRGTCVFPSARMSSRTPFGTGHSVAELRTGENNGTFFYAPDVYRLLREWLQAARSGWKNSATEVLQQARMIDPRLSDFLDETNFEDVWGRLQNNHATPERFASAFHGWFDGLKSVRLIHTLCPAAKRVPCAASVPELLRQVGIVAPVEPARQLGVLRRLQKPL
ncbi:MAG: hypothetical protein K0A93_11615 [Desulfuromonadaceae bacterium]|nr:hypothetical protein [Desulfuromonadaceae bacterium]